jgi:rubrerythrin
MIMPVHPNDWKCPGCGRTHSKPHWKDYHQKEPGWKGKLVKHGTWDKPSDEGYRIICEVCGGKLSLKKDTIDIKAKPRCPVCKEEYDRRFKYCPVDGCNLDLPEPVEYLFCKDCNEKREGVEAPLFCPHCGWGEERVVITIT